MGKKFTLIVKGGPEDLDINEVAKCLGEFSAIYVPEHLYEHACNAAQAAARDFNNDIDEIADSVEPEDGC